MAWLSPLPAGTHQRPLARLPMAKNGGCRSNKKPAPLQVTRGLVSSCDVTILGGWSEAKVRCLCGINGALLGRDREKIGPAPVAARCLDRPWR